VRIGWISLTYAYHLSALFSPLLFLITVFNLFSILLHLFLLFDSPSSPLSPASLSGLARSYFERMYEPERLTCFDSVLSPDAHTAPIEAGDFDTGERDALLCVPC
jgi:hypothetical protein